MTRPEIEWAVRRVPGVGYACGKYTLNLGGVKVSKPDTMILRWLREVTSEHLDPVAAAGLVENATASLQRDGSGVTARQIDHPACIGPGGRKAAILRSGSDVVGTVTVLKCVFVVDRSVNTSVVDSLVRALSERDVAVSLVAPDRVTVRLVSSSGRLVVDPCTEPGTVVIHRNVMEWTTLIRLASDAWSDSGATVLNDVASSIRSRNKFEAGVTLARAGIPVLDTTAFAPSPRDPRLPISEPSVVKPACGARGVGVTRVGPDDLWVEPVEEMPNSYRPFWLAQRELQTGGRDLRAFVVDGRCVALMRRTAVGDEWRANVFLGAVCEQLDPVGVVGDLAVSAVKSLGLDYASVDMFDVDGVTLVNEVDPWGGFSAISEVAGVDVAGAIADQVVAVASGCP